MSLAGRKTREAMEDEWCGVTFRALDGVMWKWITTPTETRKRIGFVRTVAKQTEMPTITTSIRTLRTFSKTPTSTSNNNNNNNSRAGATMISSEIARACHARRRIRFWACSSYLDEFAFIGQTLRSRRSTWRTRRC